MGRASVWSQVCFHSRLELLLTLLCLRRNTGETFLRGWPQEGKPPNGRRMKLVDLHCPDGEAKSCGSQSHACGWASVWNQGLQMQRSLPFLSVLADVCVVVMGSLSAYRRMSVKSSIVGERHQAGPCLPRSCYLTLNCESLWARIPCLKLLLRYTHHFKHHFKILLNV